MNRFVLIIILFSYQWKTDSENTNNCHQLGSFFLANDRLCFPCFPCAGEVGRQHIQIAGVLLPCV